MKNQLTKLFAGLALAVALLAPSVASAQSTPTKVTAGSKVVMTVTSDGTAPLTYTWQKAPANSTVFATIPGESSAVYTIPAASASDAGNYRVIVANDYGTTTSTTATLNAGSAPSITSFGVVVTPPSP